MNHWGFTRKTQRDVLYQIFCVTLRRKMACLSFATAQAYDAYVYGIYYNLNKTDETVSVISDTKYTGNIIIPSSIPEILSL